MRIEIRDSYLQGLKVSRLKSHSLKNENKYNHRLLQQRRYN